MARSSDAARLTCRLHPTVPLVLHDEAPYDNRNFVCDLCFKLGEGPTYHCRTCKYDLHPQCCTLQPTLRCCKHPHPLTLTASSSRVGKKKLCDACRSSLADCEWSYRCELCDFDVHASCAKLRDKIRTSFHPYPLKLLQKSPYPPRHLQCDLCDERMPTNAWLYHCTNCKFDLHPSCALLPRDPLCTALHPHRLRTRAYPTFHGKSYVCAVCLDFGGVLGFCCDSCNFNIHPKCLKSFFLPSSTSATPRLPHAPNFKVTAYGVHIIRKDRATSDPAAS